MQEFIGLAYYAEVPAVFFDVQRIGPSTGLPTRTQQGDLLLVRVRVARRHETHLPLPGRPGGMFRHGAGRRSIWPSVSRRRSFVVTDLDIGMNDWMVPRLEWDDEFRPGPRQGADGAAELEEIEKYGRYVDAGGDGIPARTLPGTGPEGRVLHARIGARQARAAYTEDSAAYQEFLDRHQRKIANGGRSPCRAGDRRTARRADRDRRDSAAATRRSARRSRPAERAGLSRATTCAFAVSHSTAGRGRSSNRTNGIRGGAEPRRAAALDARHRARACRATT